MAENTDYIQLATPSDNQLSKSSINNATQIQAYYCDSIQASTKQVSTTADKPNSNRPYSAANGACPTEPTPPPPPSEYLNSGYKKLPDTSFTTQATRTESYCVRWDGQEIRVAPEQPFSSASFQQSSDDVFTLNESSNIVAHQVTSTDEFLAKETQFIAPKAINRSQCVEWRQRTVSSTSGYVSVRYGKDRRLNKPIVFVQGYGGDFTKGFIMNTVANEKEQFDRFINNSHYLKSDSSKNLYNAGYDLVVFRYAKQDSGIESNAWALATLLEKLAKTSNEVKVVGHSMGGIVGKLAIMYMENKGKVHKVSDFVAIDSPFYGVHVPQDVRAFANTLEKMAGKIKSCKLYRHSSRRSQCRDERRRLKSINDIFGSYTFKQLDEGSPQNLVLRQRFKDLAIFFNPTRSTAVSYGTEIPSTIPLVYYGAGAWQNLKVDVNFYLSGAKHSRLYATPKDARNGSYTTIYYDISRELRAAKNITYSIKREVTLDNWKQGRHVFVTTDSAFSGKDGSFDNYSYLSEAHYPHSNIYYLGDIENLLNL